MGRIMLAPPSPAVSFVPAMSPGTLAPPSPAVSAMSSSSAAESDTEWQPTDFGVKKPRNKVERKKAQNRTAAWKYREKKKAEQDLVDQELELLLNKNVDLKKRLSDMELQAKCLKQLMAEAGMGYLINSL